ncbi:MAG TPA: FtsX-like permease family protein [Thermoanaerobaculia bacterium]|nr:FtsX-like permease family protein [Thermoanaerobaculia bacterium]
MTAFRLVFRALVTGPARRRPIRALVPVLGVAIGVAAVAAIHHANRSVTESFRESARSIAGRSDLVVVGAAGVPLEELERLRFLWRVGSFAPLVSGNAVLADGSGEVVAILGTDYGGEASIREMRLVAPSTAAGRLALSSPGSALAPVPFAKRHGLAIGSRLPLVVGGVRAEVTIAGLLELSGLARASGGDVLVTDVFTAARLLGRSGTVDRVDVVLDPGVSRDVIRRELSRRLSAGLWLEPPGRAAEAAGRMARAFRFNLNALGSLTLAVGMFLVANAVSVSVLRRRPEIATLRALGTSRAAVFAAFLVEGLAVGAVGTLVGEIGGLGLARSALSAVAGTVSSVYSRTGKISAADFGPAALAAAAVGMVATLLAAALPAAEATRVPPSPAMRPGSADAARRLRLPRRIAAAGIAIALAAALSRAGPINGFPYPGFAAVALVVAALALLSPALVAAGAALGRPPLERIFGAPGRLASRLFGGSPARNGIAVTALAMALGMTFAMIATVASMRATVRTWVGTTLSADLWVRAGSGASAIVGDLPPEIVAVLESVPGIAGVDPFRTREGFDAAGRAITIASSDFHVLSRAGGGFSGKRRGLIPKGSDPGFALLDRRDPRAVAEAARRSGEVLVSEPYARAYGVGRGDAIPLRTPKGRRVFRVAGVYRDFSNDRGTVLFDRSLYLELFDDFRVTSAGVVARPGTSPEALRREILARAGERFALDVITTRELSDQILRIFDRTFAVANVLEGIAVAVAVAGIANALIASAVERRRSFGLLRAVGASRAQIRRTVLIEALLAGLVATAAAFAAGAAFTALLIGVINPQSFGWSVVPTIPAGRLAGAAAIVLAASLAAGVVPGWIAAAADPAAALAEE